MNSSSIKHHLQHSWKHLFKMKGRASRKELLCFQLSAISIILTQALILFIIAKLTTFAANISVLNTILTVLVICTTLFYIFSIFTFVIGLICISVRRLHDMNWSGYLFIPWSLLAGSVGFILTNPVMQMAIDGRISPIIASTYNTAVSVLLMFIFWYRPGTNGKNSYGDVPKYDGSSTASKRRVF